MEYLNSVASISISAHGEPKIKALLPLISSLYYVTKFYKDVAVYISSPEWCKENQQRTQRPLKFHPMPLFEPLAVMTEPQYMPMGGEHNSIIQNFFVAVPTEAIAYMLHFAEDIEPTHSIEGSIAFRHVVCRQYNFLSWLFLTSTFQQFHFTVSTKCFDFFDFSFPEQNIRNIDTAQMYFIRIIIAKTPTNQQHTWVFRDGYNPTHEPLEVWINLTFNFPKQLDYFDVQDLIDVDILEKGDHEECFVQRESCVFQKIGKCVCMYVCGCVLILRDKVPEWPSGIMLASQTHTWVHCQPEAFEKFIWVSV